MVSKVNWDEFTAQNDYLQSFHPQYPNHRDYRYEPGFRLKKVMFAYRESAQKQTSIFVTFSRHDFNSNNRNNPNEVQQTNYVLVSPVVIPIIEIDEYSDQEIYDYCKGNQIFGIFLFATRKPLPIEDFPANEFYSKLYMGVYEMDAGGRLISHSEIISAVFPYYNYLGFGYIVYLHFDDTNDSNYHQTRLTLNETALGVHEMSRNQSKGKVSENCAKLLGAHHRYAAIYVGKFATLAVIFENDRRDRSIQRRGITRRRVCHERALIQSGGVVGLEMFDLRFQFMDDPNGTRHTLAGLAQTGRIVIQDGNDMGGIVHPFIVLGNPFDTTYEPNMQLPFPSYGLRVRNTDTRPPKRATLLLPTGARFVAVRELYPNSFPNPSQGVILLNTLWNKKLFKESTGKYADANPNGIDGQTRSAFPYGDGRCLAP